MYWNMTVQYCTASFITENSVILLCFIKTLFKCVKCILECTTARIATLSAQRSSWKIHLVMDKPDNLSVLLFSSFRSFVRAQLLYRAQGDSINQSHLRLIYRLYFVVFQPLMNVRQACCNGLSINIVTFSVQLNKSLGPSCSEICIAILRKRSIALLHNFGLLVVSERDFYGEGPVPWHCDLRE